MKIRTILAAALLCVLNAQASASPVAAHGTEGFAVIAAGGEVIARYEGTSAGYTNLLFLDNGDDDLTNDMFIFNNHTSLVGSTVSLGTFEAGTELVFRLFVTNTGYNFYSGADERNPDGVAHARVEADYLSMGTTLVSFEDLYGGPFEYNDLSFTFTNTMSVEPDIPPVPVPPGALLVLTGSAALFGLRRRSKRD